MGWEGWLMKLIGHVAQPHDKRSAVTSLAGQDVIIGSCTRLERRELRIKAKPNSSHLTNTFHGDNTILEIIRKKKQPSSSDFSILNCKFLRIYNLYTKTRRNLYRKEPKEKEKKNP